MTEVSGKGKKNKSAVDAKQTQNVEKYPSGVYPQTNDTPAPKKDEESKNANEEKALKPTVEDAQRIFQQNTPTKDSRLEPILKKLADGPIAKEGSAEGLLVVDFSVGSVRRHISGLNLKTKLRARSRVKGQSKPTIIARVA